jgi:hypothetical protein
VGRSLLALAVLMFFALVGLWTHPGAVTQDGPAHLYSAEVLRAAAAGQIHPAFEIRRQPIPNVLGHLLLALISSVFGPFGADRALLIVTSAGLAAAVVFLRHETRGEAGLLWIAPYAAFISLNRMWLMGFYSFLLGCSLFAVTGALCWRWRLSATPVRLVAISALLLAGYLAHPVTLGATLLALVVIAARTGRRLLAGTAVAAVPATGLMLWYLATASGHGAIRPEWNLGQAFAPRFFFIAQSDSLPFTIMQSPLFGVVAGPTLFAAAVVLMAWKGAWREGRPFAIVTGLLLAAALLGPEALGQEHGSFLRQRLLGLAAISVVPLWNFPPRFRIATGGLLLAALLMQAAHLAGYSRHADAVVRDLLAREAEVGDQASVLPIIVSGRTPYRASPEEHAGNLLGLKLSRTVWGNYEGEIYYFPVAYRVPLATCPDEQLPLYDGMDLEVLPKRQQWRVRRFVCSAVLNADRLDTLVTRGVPPEVLQPWLGGIYERVPPRRGVATEIWEKRSSGEAAAP